MSVRDNLPPGCTTADIDRAFGDASTCLECGNECDEDQEICDGCEDYASAIGESVSDR